MIDCCIGRVGERRSCVSVRARLTPKHLKVGCVASWADCGRGREVFVVLAWGSMQKREGNASQSIRRDVMGVAFVQNWLLMSSLLAGWTDLPRRTTG